MAAIQEYPDGPAIQEFPIEEFPDSPAPIPFKPKLNPRPASGKLADLISATIGDPSGLGVAGFTRAVSDPVGELARASGMTPETLSKPLIKIDKSSVPKGAGIIPELAGGASDFVGGLVEGLSSPDVMAKLALGGLGKGAAEIVSAKFISDMAANAPEQAAEVGKKLGEGDKSGAATAFLNYAAGVVAPAVMAKGELPDALTKGDVTRLLSKQLRTAPIQEFPDIPPIPITQKGTPNENVRTPETIPVQAQEPAGATPAEETPVAPSEVQPWRGSASEAVLEPVPPEAPTTTDTGDFKTQYRTALQKMSSLAPEHPDSDAALQQAFSLYQQDPVAANEVENEFESTATATPEFQSPTRLANETADAERKARGLDPLFTKKRQSDPQTWDLAMERIDADSTSPEKLQEELSKNPRAPTDVEAMMLLHRKVSLRNSLDAASGELAKAVDSGDSEGASSARVKANIASDALATFEDFNRQVAGREAGASLRARRLMMNNDYSLAQMELDKRTDNGGRQLTDEERADVKKQYDDLSAKQKALDDHEASLSEREGRLRTEELKREIETEKRRPAATRQKPSVPRRVVAALETKAAEARSRLAGKFLSPSPKDLLDLATISAYRIAEGIVNFGEWSKDMIDTFTEKVKPYLQDAWDKGKELANQLSQAHDAQAVIYKLKSKLDAGKWDSVSPLLNKLAKQIIAGGTHDYLTLVGQLHDVLKSIDPNITQEQTMDAYAGYGKFKTLSKNAIDVENRDIKGQVQKVRKLLDMWQGARPKKSGLEMPIPSDVQRRLIAIVNAAKKAFGLEVQDPATQLKSALGSIKTRLTNQIADLEHQISTRTKTVRDKTSSPSDAETEALRAQRDALKKQFDEIFPRDKKPITDEQRVAAAIRSTQASIDEYERRIKAGETQTTKTPSKTPETPELKAARARRDALKDEFQHLQDLDGALQENKAVVALQKSIDEYTRKITEGDLSFKTGKLPVSTPQTEALRAQRDKLVKTLQELREASGANDAARLQKAKDSAIAAITENIHRIEQSDVAARKRTPGFADAELEELRKLRAASTKMIQEARQAALPKKSPEEIALQSAKTRMTKRIADLEERTAAGDFSQRPKRPVQLDAEGQQKQQALKAAELKYHEARQKDRLKNRPATQKVEDAIVKWSRVNKLSSLTVFPKLIEAGIIRIITNPINRILAQPLRAIPGLAEKAPYQLKLSAKAELKSLSAVLTSGPQALKKLLTGKSSIDIASGKPARLQEMANFVGNAHGALKEPVRQGAYARSAELNLQEMNDAGIDTTEPVAQVAAVASAVADANHEIFMGKNPITTYLHDIPMAALRNADFVGAKSLANTIDFLMPIVRVTTNIGIHAMRLNPAVGFTEAFSRLAVAAKRGELADKSAKLSKEDASAISRAFGAGMLGTILAGYAWTHPEHFGGEFNDEEKHKKGGLKFGQIEIMEKVIPSWMNHAPEINWLNTVASARRIYDRYYATHPNDKLNAETSALAFSIMAPVKNFPFVDTWLRIYGEHQTMGQASGQIVRDAVIPGAVTRTLQATDSQQRKPKNFTQEIEMGIPGLRKNVPVAKPPLPAWAKPPPLRR